MLAEWKVSLMVFLMEMMLGDLKDEEPVGMSVFPTANYLAALLADSMAEK
jgi:hypothetical protein